MPPGSWQEDEWYTSDSYEGTRHVPPRRRYSRGREEGRSHLTPEHHTSVHMHRSRSQGRDAGAPRVTIYNTIDDHQRMSQSPLPSPRGSPRGRAAGRLADELDDLEALAELRRARSRSRGPLFRETEASYERMQLELANERLKEKERERREEEYKEMVKKEYEYKKERELRRREEHERDEERDRRRIIDEENLRIAKAKRDNDDLRDRARAEWERKEREAKKEREDAVAEYERKRRKEQDDLEAERKAIIAEYENKKTADEKKAKAEEEAWRVRIKMEDELRKEKEKKEYEEFLLRQKQKEEEEKRKKKEAEEKLEEEMTKRLAEFGFQNNQIQAMIKPEKRKDLLPGQSPGNPLMLTGHAHGQPTYIKVHRDHIAVETLTYFDIPWEYDRNDRDFIIILREMDQRETDVLFEHTRSIRGRASTRLMIEERREKGKKPEYSWVRHKSRSRSPAGRRKSSPKRIVGIKEMFF